ncbi:MAG: hypothetical protein ACREB8_05805 [Pseudolabrys sp.]
MIKFSASNGFARRNSKIANESAHQSRLFCECPACTQDFSPECQSIAVRPRSIHSGGAESRRKKSRMIIAAIGDLAGPSEKIDRRKFAPRATAAAGEKTTQPEHERHQGYCIKTDWFSPLRPREMVHPGRRKDALTHPARATARVPRIKSAVSRNKGGLYSPDEY